MWAWGSRLRGGIAAVCIEKRDVIRTVCHASDPWPQKEASPLCAALFSVSEMCDWARSCPYPLSGNQLPNGNVLSPINFRDELRCSQEDFSSQKACVKGLCVTSLQPSETQGVCKVTFRHWLRTRHGVLSANTLLPGV